MVEIFQQRKSSQWRRKAKKKKWYLKGRMGNRYVDNLSVRTYFCYMRIRDVIRTGQDSLTETKNWGGRNEATETSGRLHLLWLQNKQIHSPRTADRLHTRQDRWIQKELARTHTKNATKPNPFQIIPLQPTRKENNWETEEAMERAALTLETERVKWPNPGCLWWWWLGQEKCKVIAQAC